MNASLWRLPGLLLLVTLVCGCTGLRPGFEQPSISVVSLQPVSAEGFAPRFEIGLRVVNPNLEALTLRGMSYQLLVDEVEMADGATADLPVVPGYGEAEFKVTAVVSLLGGARFLGKLMQDADGAIDYTLRVKLDVGAMSPAIRIEESGRFGAGL